MAVIELAQQAKAASIPLSDTTLDVRNRALVAIADALKLHAEEITAANQRDMDASDGLDDALKKRLVFNDKKLADVIAGLQALAELPDPIGRVITKTELADGMHLTSKRSVCRSASSASSSRQGRTHWFKFLRSV